MRKSGFTFLELLIALSLFTVGMVTVLQIFPVNRRYLTQSGQITQASFLAQEQIEAVRALDYETLTSGTYEARHAIGAASSDPLNQFERQTTVTLIDGNRATTVTDVGLKKVDVIVYWSERTISRQYSLSTYVYQK